jgi:hypothetical protein
MATIRPLCTFEKESIIREELCLRRTLSESKEQSACILKDDVVGHFFSDHFRTLLLLT